MLTRRNTMALPQRRSPAKPLGRTKRAAQKVADKVEEKASEVQEKVAEPAPEPEKGSIKKGRRS